MSKSTLVIWDHDGTLCQSTNLAYESLKYAGQASAQNMGYDPLRLINEWDHVIAKTAGTTDKAVTQECCYILGISNEAGRVKYEQLFYDNRAKWINKMKQSGEYIYDTYYPDAEELVSVLGSAGYHQMFSTGNPTNVMEERIAPHMRKNFVDEDGKLLGAFGEEGLMRADILKLAVEKAEKIFDDFKVEKAEDGFMTNVFYVADTYKDFIAALKMRIRMIWIPSRSLPMLKEVLAKEHIEALAEIFKDDIRIVNSLHSNDVKEFLGLE